MNGTDSIIGRSLKEGKTAVKHFYWRVYGLFVDRRLPISSDPGSLLFVCKGNICRSPFAEAAARRQVPDGLRIACSSGGIDVTMPKPCPEETVTAAERFGIDLSGHRSRRIDAGLMAGAGMVLTMEAWQASRLRKAFPEHREKIFLLPLFEEDPPQSSDAGSVLNIRDPYGRPLGEVIECFERIDTCLKGVFTAIRDAGNRSAPSGDILK